MANGAFDIWTDYLGLSQVLEGIFESRHRETHSKMEPMERQLRSGQVERRELEGRAPQLQHRPANTGSHSLTMEIGAGLYLTINTKDVEKTHCKGETERHCWLDFMNCNSDAEGRRALIGRKPIGKETLARRRTGGAQRHDLLGGLFESTVSSGDQEPGLPALHLWGDKRGEETKCDLTAAQFVGKIRQDCSVCTFCKQNGESKKVYSSHVLKDANGKIVCPILRGYTCPLCHATGDNAHTKRFCHLLQSNYRSMYKKHQGTRHL
ncbi:uncharacterized protein LOC121271192 [Carcharodon carcharias]|uniref:uncharacterized protein LOC121271192 n=1 Tax=Carcharodon carcharias TaxID=13397 RepID=UPI001B7E1B52|nr:uncharacterized protein LOC121271192 [Carcharodon carcharias]